MFWFLKILEMDQSYPEIINIKLFNILLRYCVRLFNSSFFYWIETIVIRFGYRRNVIPLCPDISDPSLPIKYVEFTKSNGIGKLERYGLNDIL